MRVALMFNRHDVDAFLNEIDAAQFDEWCLFQQAEPQGWPAAELIARRVSFIIAQTRSKKRLRERDFTIRTRCSRVADAKVEAVRLEMFAIRGRVRERLGLDDAAAPKG